MSRLTILDQGDTVDSVRETREPISPTSSSSPSFYSVLREHRLQLAPVGIDTLQVNITKLCNQACLHCHVGASPKRTESMSPEGVEQCLKVLADHASIETLDITGGAPELHPQFAYLASTARGLGKKVIVRHNLTVALDLHPKTNASMLHLHQFFADHRLTVVSSLPYYQKFFTDKQRGRGVFEKSVESLKRLNSLGYGGPGTGLELHLVYNPAGAFLPASQPALEQKFKEELERQYGICFNSLFVLTNMPLSRFRDDLDRHGRYEEYMEKLVAAFNPVAARGVMCRSLVSVGYDGTLYDCDFNQMLELPIRTDGRPLTIFDFQPDGLLERKIVFAQHCFGCTAGAGSSCGGQTAAESHE